MATASAESTVDPDMSEDDFTDSGDDETSSADSSNPNPGENAICLGFLENTESWKLSSKYFPSKVGGFPAWLALNDIPQDERLTCFTCKRPMTFLLQLYLPDSTRPSAFHRTIFIFVCRDGKCCRFNESAGFRVFRCELPRSNDYYPYEPPVEDEASSNTPSAKEHCQLCCVCGAPGDKKCAQCHCTTYCSRLHQAIHWRDGHRQECKELVENSGDSKVKTNSFLFPEAEIILEPIKRSSKTEAEEQEQKERELTLEELKGEFDVIRQSYDPTIIVKDYEIDPDNKRETFEKPKVDRKWSGRGKNVALKRYKQMVKDAQHLVGGTFTDFDNYLNLEEVANKDKDKFFIRFMEMQTDEPDQVIRYHRNGKPMLCSSITNPLKSHPVNNCHNCKRPRRFEFQVQPQLLYHLKVDVKDGPSLDWGVLLVFTCSCRSPRPYIEERIIKQDYPPDD